MGVVILRIHHQVSYFKFSLQLKCLLDKLMRQIIQRKNRKSNPRPILENEFKDQKSKSFLSYKLDLQSRLFPLTIFLISSKWTFLTIFVWPLTMIFLGPARKPSATKSAKSCQSACFSHEVQVKELQLLKILDEKIFYVCKRCNTILLPSYPDTLHKLQDLEVCKSTPKSA